MRERKSCLSIAGSDPSGGAGIQADLKVFHQFGVYGEAAITLLTVQNTRSVERVELVPTELVLAQITGVVADIPPQAAKTGALGSPELIEAIGRAAAEWTFPLVVDPVLISKHGASLASGDAAEAFRAYLLPRAAVITPNLPEASALCGFAVETEADMDRAADRLIELGARAVLVKGGHLAGDAVDLLVMGSERVVLRSERIDTRHTHGTGCTYSAAIAAGLALGQGLEEAVRSAKAYVHRGIEGNPGLGGGSGPLNHWA